MIVISDTGPLISLAEIDKLSLLEKLYGEVYIPEAVWKEVQRYKDKENLSNIDTLKTRVRKVAIKNEFFAEVDFGEAEALTLYQELNADYFLVEDRHAKTVALANSITVLGTLTVLVEAKKLALIENLRPLFIQLLAKGRYFSKFLLNKTLADNGEEELPEDL